MNFAEYKKKLLRDPDFLKEYEGLTPNVLAVDDLRQQMATRDKRTKSETEKRDMAPHDYNAPRKTNNSLIAQARISKGWTQAQLADAMGAAQQQINAWETGVRKPKMQTLIKIAEALGVDWLDLVEK